MNASLMLKRVASIYIYMYLDSSIHNMMVCEEA